MPLLPWGGISPVFEDRARDTGPGKQGLGNRLRNVSRPRQSARRRRGSARRAMTPRPPRPSKLIFSFHANPKQNAERCLVCHQSSRDQKDFGHTPTIFSTESPAIAAIPCIWSKPDEPAGRAMRHRAKQFLQRAQAAGSKTAGCTTANWQSRSRNSAINATATSRRSSRCPLIIAFPKAPMKCSDCHNPHGTSNRADWCATGRRPASQCHVEKRGPFRLRTSRVEDRRLHRLPYSARQHQPHAAGPPRGAFSVPAVPRESDRRSTCRTAA